MLGRPAPRELTIAVLFPGEDEANVVYQGEFKMARYDLSLSNKVTKDGKPFTTQQPMTWHDLDADGFAALCGMAKAVEAEVKKAANKNGPVAVTLTSAVTSSDGAAIPPDANGTSSYAGITLHGLADIEEAMQAIGGQLVKMGRAHAENKEGKKK
jgi:hypothetical protein